MPTIKNIATILAAFILLISLCFSCNFSQKELPQKNILQVEYYVRYLQTDKQVKASISFMEIDSTKKRMAKRMEEVLFANNSLNGEKVGNQYRYQLTKELPFAAKYDWSYRLNNTKTVTNKINIEPISDFVIKKGKVSKTAGTNLTFEGVELSSKETLVLLLSDANNKTVTIKIDNHPRNAPITILPEHVNRLAVGSGTLYLVKKENIQTESDGIQVTGLTEYYSTVKAIEVIE